MLLVVPSGTFDEHTIDVATIFRLLGNVLVVLVILEFEFEGKFIDSNNVLSGKVLEGTGQESLREEET